MHLTHSPYFQSRDVFSDGVYERINSHTIPVQGWLDFWGDILKVGHVTDIFMTPRWEVSTGARDEYRIAQELGLTIHQLTEAHHTKEKPFEGLQVYYSGSIKGVPEAEPDFPWQLVQYMGKGGADVLSEHVAARNQQEMDEIRARRWGMEVQEMLAQPEPWFGIRRNDIEWVDQVTHVVALVNAPSHGVGMEIERAILKPERGLNETPILCLVHKQMLDKLSFMVRGVTEDESPRFQLRTYSHLEDAKIVIHDFLTDNKL